MTNEQVLILANGLGKISPPKMVGSFNYAISENLQNAVRIAKNIREYIKDSDPVKEFKEQLTDLQEEFAEKNDKGKIEPTIINLPNGSQIFEYKIPTATDPNSEFNTRLNKLKERYKDDIKEQDKRLKFLQDKSDQFEPWLIKVEEIPDGLSRDEMNLVHMLVEKPKL